MSLRERQAARMLPPSLLLLLPLLLAGCGWVGVGYLLLPYGFRSCAL